MNHTVMTLTTAQRNYLRAAIACLLAAEGGSDARIVPDRHASSQRLACADLCCIAEFAAGVPSGALPLTHQEGAELADLLAAGTLELHVPAGGITPYFDDEPGTYTDQVGPDEDAWKVPGC